jgi:hypothetical protein
MYVTVCKDPHWSRLGFSMTQNTKVPALNHEIAVGGSRRMGLNITAGKSPYTPKPGRPQTSALGCGHLSAFLQL